MDGWGFSIDAIEAHEGVDFEVGKVEINVYRVEANEEVDKSVLLLFGYVSEKGSFDFLAGREGLVDGNTEFEGLGVYITNIDTTLVSEEDIVAFTSRVDANIEFGVGRVGQEGFDNKRPEGTLDGLDLENVFTLVE